MPSDGPELAALLDIEVDDIDIPVDLLIYHLRPGQGYRQSVAPTIDPGPTITGLDCGTISCDHLTKRRP